MWWAFSGAALAATLLIQGCGGSAEDSPAISNRTVLLQWSPSPSRNVVGYFVHRSTISGGPYTRITPAPHPEISFTDTSVPVGTWYYVVTAVNHGNHESRPSNEAVAQVP